MDKVRKKRLLQLLKQGLSERQIYETLGVSRSTLRIMLQETGHKVRDFNINPERSKILRDYNKTNDVGLTAQRLGLSYSKVYYNVKIYGKG